MGSTIILEYSARNDWSSTLPEENNSFFYQAVGVSAILTDILNIDGNTINFLKLRASYGTTGKDADIYLLNSVYVANPTLQSLANNHDLFFPLNGQAGFTQGNRIGNPGLMPELTTTFEVGVDASFFNDRVALEYTYYDSKHTNQIVVVTLPNSTGYTSTVKNLGEMQNSGHEVSLTLRPLVSLDRRGLSWDITFLYAKNRNEVIKINPEGDQQELTIDNFYGVNEVAAVGLPYGTFKGQVVRTNDAGQVVVDATGLPLLSDDLEYLGSYQPDWTGSIANTLDGGDSLLIF
jgi:outer membrane receptor protein involved in Fe transport